MKVEIGRGDYFVLLPENVAEQEWLDNKFGEDDSRDAEIHISREDCSGMRVVTSVEIVHRRKVKEPLYLRTDEGIKCHMRMHSHDVDRVDADYLVGSQFLDFHNDYGKKAVLACRECRDRIMKEYPGRLQIFEIGEFHDGVREIKFDRYDLNEVVREYYREAIKE